MTPLFGMTPSSMYRYRFNLDTGEVKEEFLDDRLTEFPMINAREAGRKTRFSYNQSFDISDILRFDGLVKYDTQTGKTQFHSYGEGVYGSEAPFVPRPGATEEDDGYIITFVTDEASDSSQVLILDAREVDRPPLARIHLPQRVPLGFHACWVEGEWLNA